MNHARRQVKRSLTIQEKRVHLETALEFQSKG
jgi:hypothetical protein